MKKFFKLLFLFTLIFCLAGNSYATVITFDDVIDTVPDPTDYLSGIGTIPDGYMGFNWDWFGVIHKDYYPGTGFQSGVVSGNYVAYNEWAQVATVNDDLFVLYSVQVTSAYLDTLEVTITGYRGGSEVYATNVTAVKDGPTLCEFTATKIDTLVFSTSPQSQFVIDDLTFSNAPVAPDAGENITIGSNEQISTIIYGTAFDPDGDPLSYRWLEGTTALSVWQNVGAAGEAYLDLSTVPYFSIGDHILTLEVKLVGTQLTATDEMILTVNNSAPSCAPTGGGIYELFEPVMLGGEVADFDGDMLSYEWLEGDTILFSGVIGTIYGGDPVAIPEYILTDVSLGIHVYTLRVSDGINSSVSNDIIVEVKDSSAPTLCPKANKGILWPPNHKMVDIVIEANAVDNSGGVVTLTATVSSNEPEDGLGDGDMYPDYTEIVIDQENGLIYLQVRSERSGCGTGRVYEVLITATDESGNSSEALVNILVPHSRIK